MENTTNFNDEQIEKKEAELKLSKKTMRETHEKYDETGKMGHRIYQLDSTADLASMGWIGCAS